MSDPFHSARQMYREGRYRDAALAAFAGMNEEPGNARGVRLAAMCMMQSRAVGGGKAGSPACDGP
jgi:hypothetical protein